MARQVVLQASSQALLQAASRSAWCSQQVLMFGWPPRAESMSGER